MPNALGLMIWLPLSAAHAQQPPPPSAPAPAAKPQRVNAASDPYKAYAQGRYDQALQSFVDQQVEHPHDPRLMLNIGNIHYKMKNYAEARQAFAQAALRGDPTLRAQAYYNLGNTAYREGKLQEAVDLYKQALAHNPNDEDAKYNIEFVRDEIRRRLEEAKKRGQQQAQGGAPENADPGQTSEASPEQNGEQNQDGQGSQAPGGTHTDSDGDGLSDEQERKAQNPTDPSKADSDGDGMADGQEDKNRNGSVDAGETNPNTPDAAGQAQRAEQQRDDGAEHGQQAQGSRALSAEEAQRYLNQLSEERPTRRAQGQRRSRPAKDW